MITILIFGGMFLGSAAAGFALNRFALKKISSEPGKAIALALSRAVFYAPSLIDVGHGVLFPYPFLGAIENSFLEFGTDLNVFIFLLPIIVFLGSLFISWVKSRKRPTRRSSGTPQKRGAP